MIERDVLVALVAFGLGLFILHAAYIQRPSCFEFWLVKKFEAKYGRQKARTAVGITGILMFALGVWVIVFPSKVQTSGPQSHWIHSLLGHNPAASIEVE